MELQGHQGMLTMWDMNKFKVVETLKEKQDLYGPNQSHFQITTQNHGVLIEILTSQGGHMNVFLWEDTREV